MKRSCAESQLEPLRRARLNPLSRFFAAILIFSALEGLLFHTGYYASILKPDSSAGTLLTRIRNEQARPLAGTHQVLAVGDSRMLGLLPKLANQQETGYTFASIAAPGTTERCWYYMLRETDPQARRYSAIVIPAYDYDDEDWEDMADRIQDLHFLTPLIRLQDVIEFSASFPSWSNRWQAFGGSLLKGWSYRRDFQDFLVHHRQRMFEVRKNSARTYYDYVPGPQNLEGLSVDWKTQEIQFPAGVTADQRRALKDSLLRGFIPQTGQRAAYRRKWFGKIVQHYRASRTRLIFIRLPRGPVERPELVKKMSSSIREFEARGEVTLAGEHLFDELENTRYFWDSLHLNGPGSQRFTILLVQEVARILGRPVGP